MQITFEGVIGGDEVYMDCLTLLSGSDRESCLDIGCNHSPFVPRLGFKQRKYIDIMERTLDNIEEQPFFEKADALHHLRQDVKYSTIFSLDQIEHVTKEYGWEQIRLMEKYSDRQVLFTPLDPWMMTDSSDTNPESHRSVWRPEEFDDTWVKIVFPNYHPTLSIGAWFFMRCDSPKQEFERISNELKQKSWAKGLQVL